MTEEEEHKLEKEMLIQSLTDLEKEKQELADKIVELTKQNEKEIEDLKMKHLERVETLKLRLPRFAMIIDAMFREDENGTK